MVKCGLQSWAARINFWTPFRAAYNQGRLTFKGGLQSSKYGMALSFRKYYFIWPNKNDWATAYNYCTKKHYQRK